MWTWNEEDANGSGYGLSYNFAQQHEEQMGVKDSYPHGSAYFLSIRNLDFFIVRRTYSHYDANLVSLENLLHRAQSGRLKLFSVCDREEYYHQGLQFNSR